MAGLTGEQVDQERWAAKRKHDKEHQLPIAAGRDRIIEAIKQNSTVIIVGETGSGKTTQVPQYLVQAGFTRMSLNSNESSLRVPKKSFRNQKMIAITQPRRVAAMTLARRVADELHTKLGDRVGFAIRFEDTTSSRTEIKFMTDGLLLREMLVDPLLTHYSVVVLDEAHERTVRTDILFAMLKNLQQSDRKDLKIVIMSATLDPKKFSSYFSNAPVLYVAGRQYPVRYFAAVQPAKDYLDATALTIFQIHCEQPAGDILAFLPGQEEIEIVEKLIESNVPFCQPSLLTSSSLMVCSLFAALPSTQQWKVFESTPMGFRKVVLATNIAETSVTIPGIRYVIDSGFTKVKHFHPRLGTEMLLVEPISKAAARQRAGRAGREGSGSCYRLYTQEAFEDLEEEAIPEIKRCPLTSTVLCLKAYGVDNVLKFDFMDQPSQDSLAHALEQLYTLRALNDQGCLTPLGKQMAEFPLDPILSKILLTSKDFNCTRDCLALIALLSVETIFYAPYDKRDEAAVSKKQFIHYEGDHLTLLRLFNCYRRVKADVTWCQNHFVNYRSMKHVMDIYNQLMNFAQRLKLMDSNDETTRVPVSNDCNLGQDQNWTERNDFLEDTISLRKCILSGFFHHTALLQHDGTYKTLLTKQIVRIHPSSVLFGKKPACVVFNELVSYKIDGNSVIF